MTGSPGCPGVLPRRTLLRSGFGTLGLAELLRLEAAAASADPTRRPTGKSIVVLWLWGGPSHLETFDLKPDAPEEFRGEFRPIATPVPGMRICEHLPRIAAQGRRIALIRSLTHASTGHVNSTHTLLTAYPGEEVETPPYKPRFPDSWAVINRETGDWSRGLPPYVALGGTRYHGAAYLGSALDPLVVRTDPNASPVIVPELSAPGERTSRRAGLLERVDGLRRAVDAAAESAALDQFQRQALSLLTGARAARAFDLSEESAATRDRYGRHAVGQRMLLARRLVEAGARLVTIDFPSVPGQKAFSWDDHASVWNIFTEMKARLPVLDQVVSAFVEDVSARGLSDDVLLVVMGEMGRTPRLSNHQGQPGREHWGRAMSILLAGGGLPMGQVVGETNPRGEEPATRPVTPTDLQATWYRYLGIPLDLHYMDRSGRPVPILPSGQPIPELFPAGGKREGLVT